MAERILERSSQLYLKFANPHPDSPFGSFLKTRGLSEEIAKEYALGFAPKSNSFLEYLQSIPKEEDRNFATSYVLMVITAKIAPTWPGQ